MKNIILFTAVLFTLFIRVRAQSSANQTISLDLQNAFSISIISLGDLAQYPQGINPANVSTVQVESNRYWSVTVTASDETFGGAEDDSNKLPASVLAVRVVADEPSYALATEDATLTRGKKGKSSFEIDYDARQDRIGRKLSVLYTATQQ